MFNCPQCNMMLSTQKSPSVGLTWVCPSCHGRALTLELLRHVVPASIVNRLWQRARSGQYAATRRCPACNRPMTEVPIIATEDKTVYLDVCTGCHFVWFDTQEFESLPKVPAKSPEAEALPQEAREAIALAQLEIIRQESEVTEANAPPDYWWQLVVGLTEVPVEHNDVPC